MIMGALLAGAFVASEAARAQDFLSPTPMVPRPSPQQQQMQRPAPQQQKAPAPQAQPPRAQPQPQRAAAPAAGAAQPALDISEEVGDWRLQCTSKPARACKISQRRVSQINQSMLIWVELTRSLQPEPKNLMTVMVPLGIRITPTLDMRADGKTFIEPSIVTCVAAGCVHSIELQTQRLDALQDVKLVTTQIADVQGRSTNIEVSMRGFRDAYLKTALYLRAK